MSLAPSAVEYGLLVSLIAVAIILAVTTLGSKLSATFNDGFCQTWYLN